jgi:hypothetical protein
MGVQGGDLTRLEMEIANFNLNNLAGFEILLEQRLSGRLCGQGSGADGGREQRGDEKRTMGHVSFLHGAWRSMPIVI